MVALNKVDKPNANPEKVKANNAAYKAEKERTAAALGVSLKTLYNRLKEYSAEGLIPPSSLGNGEPRTPPPGA
jgi:DNA-binding NtrC family response regulator